MSEGGGSATTHEASSTSGCGRAPRFTADRIGHCADHVGRVEVMLGSDDLRAAGADADGGGARAGGLATGRRQTQARAHLSRLLVADRVAVAVEVDQHRSVADARCTTWPASIAEHLAADQVGLAVDPLERDCRARTARRPPGRSPAACGRRRPPKRHSSTAISDQQRRRRAGSRWTTSSPSRCVPVRVAWTSGRLISSASTTSATTYRTRSGRLVVHRASITAATAAWRSAASGCRGSAVRGCACATRRG